MVLLAETKECSVFQMKNSTGEGIMTMYQVFPGLTISYNDYHMESFDSTYPPDLISPPKGCAFAKRCNYCMNVCLEETPEITNFEAGHHTSCWLHHKEVPASVKKMFTDDRKIITVNENGVAVDEGE